jgi:Family of unknown function (DUF6338)
MPDLKDAEYLPLVLLFVVPGLVASFVRSRLIAGPTPSTKENFLIFVVLSLFYYAFIVFLIQPALSVREPWIARAAIWILLLLVGPAIFGFVLGVAAQKEWGTWCANKLGVSIVHVIPAAWDWRFSNIAHNTFVMVTLTSGEKVAGYFGNGSFASSDANERDLYIEEEYMVSGEGKWEARPEKVGLLISAREIRYIEFWQTTGTEEAND